MKRLVPLLLLIFALPVMAKRQFDVEVIIFKRNISAEQTNESWPNTLPPIDFSRVGSLTSQAYLEKKGVTLLPLSSYQLNDQEQRLRNHAGFKVLLHTAWRQGDQSKYYAPIFHILAGKNYSGQFNANGTSVNNTQISPIDGVTESSMPSPVYELDGKLQIYVQHYLYADAEFDLKEPSVRDISLISNQPGNMTDNTEDKTSEDQNDTTKFGHLENVSPEVRTETFLKSYRLDQKRRMKSGETHYFDHPLMGMIIQVRKVK
ncbi:peptidoglycan binding protein CsiV [Vibrio salinus]|uniref:peptidoglycan binding protein CsiV n=1 Tax=Vibrio salinus TaxID=2899784 RepID=UPI001E2E3149|nr:peptidoglycan binding protein CsiV [Vibrio salinus]MCE0492861.1 peptidoglycan binding protein CsiV [Vibrio salinus]